VELRPYQRDALEASKQKFKAGVTRQLIALPTGTGKTPLFACVPDFFGFQDRCMVLVHREELAQQAADKLRTWNPNRTVGVEMANSYAGSADLVVASVATLGRLGSSRIESFNPDDFQAIICDEAHHSTANSYKNVFNHFGLLHPDSTRLLLGVTATPNRGDGAALADVYDEIIYQMSILDAIKNGWLVDIKGVRVRTEQSLDGVHTVAGDFAQNELAETVNTNSRNDLIVRKWIEQAKERQTVVFTVDIQHAKDLAEAFGRYGVAAQAVWGDDPERQTKLTEHRRGNLRVLCNCGVLTEGYDDPGIGCIVMARPTKSNLLFSQMAGRGTRLPEGIQNLNQAKLAKVPLSKTDCLLMDVVDNTSRHSLVTVNTIFGLGGNLDLKGNSVVDALKKMEDAAKKVPAADLSQVEDLNKLNAYLESVDLFAVKYPETVLTNSTFQWHQNTAKDSYVLLLPDNESVVINQDLLGNYNIVGTIKGNKVHDNVGKNIAEAFHQADSLISTFGHDLLHLLRREAGWHSDPATPRQLGLLRRLGITVPPNLSKGDAAKKINQHFASKGRPFYMTRERVTA